MATISNTNDKVLQAASYRSKVTTVTISSTAGAFKTPKNGAVMTPASITLTATPNSVFTASAVYTWHYAISTAPTAWVLIGTGSSQTITNSTIASIIGEATQITYKCTVTEALLDTAYGFYSVSYSKEISEPIVIDVTRTVATLSCSSAGVVSSFANTDTSISVSRGGTALTYSSVGGANTYKVSIVADGNRTVGTISNSSTVYSISGITAAALDYTTVVFSITVYDAAGVAQTPIGKQISYTKVYAGTPGTSGTSGTKSITINAFKWANTTQTAPTQVMTYSWTTGPSIYPSTWSSTASASPGTGYTLYQLQLTVTAPGTDTVTTANWSSSVVNVVGYTQKGADGTSGTKSITINAFKWANTTQTAPTQAMTYTWATGPSIYPTGWTATAPVSPGTGYTLYQLQLTISAAGADTVTSTNWSSSLVNIVGYTQKGADGTSGTKSITINAFKWDNTTQTAPTQAMTYTWATGPSIYPAGWTATAPVSPGTGYTLYQLQLTVTAPGADTFTSTNWSSSVVNIVGYTQKGADGTSGTKSITINAFKWDNTTQTAPTQAMTYTWATGPSIYPTGWTATAPVSPGTGYTLYQLQLTVTAPGADTFTSTNWSSSVVNIVGYTQKGADGTSGTKSITINAFKWDNTTQTAPTQAMTYTWGTGPNTYPIGWTAASPVSPGTGYTLYQLQLTITAPATDTITSTNWSASTVNTVGYTQKGDTGVQGNSARTAYVVTTSGTAPTTPTPGTGDTVPTSAAGTWSFAASSTLLAGQYMYQTDGILVTGGNISWGPPYLSNLKVGSLSALSADLGVVQIATTGSLSSAGKTYGGATAGYFLGYSGGSYVLDIGTSSNYMRWDGTNLVTSGITVKNASGSTILDATGSNIAPWIVGVNSEPAAGFLSLVSPVSTTNTAIIKAVGGDESLKITNSGSSAIKLEASSSNIWDVIYKNGLNVYSTDGDFELDGIYLNLKANTTYIFDLSITGLFTSATAVKVLMPTGSTGRFGNSNTEFTYTSGLYEIASLNTSYSISAPYKINLIIHTGSQDGLFKVYFNVSGTAAQLYPGCRFRCDRIKQIIAPARVFTPSFTTHAAFTSGVVAPTGVLTTVTGQAYTHLITINAHRNPSPTGTYGIQANNLGYFEGDYSLIWIASTGTVKLIMGAVNRGTTLSSMLFDAPYNVYLATQPGRKGIAVECDLLSGLNFAVDAERITVRYTRTLVSAHSGSIYYGSSPDYNYTLDLPLATNTSDWENIFAGDGVSPANDMEKRIQVYFNNGGYSADIFGNTGNQTFISDFTITVLYAGVPIPNMSPIKVRMVINVV